MKTIRIILLAKNWKRIVAVCIASYEFLAFGSEIFVAGYGSGVVQRFDSVTRSSTTFASGFRSPIGLAFDTVGNFYVGDYDASTIYRFSSNGVRTTFAATGLTYPMGLAIDAAGNVYAANLWGNNIAKYTPGGVASVFATISQPKGLAFDHEGNLYVSTADNTILRYDSFGHSSFFATAAMGLNGPLGLQFDAAGNLFVANYWNSNIIKRDTAGNWSVFATTPPGYSNPLGLALDADGSIYVTCAGNFIEKFDAQGNGTFFASTPNGPWMVAIKPVSEPVSTNSPPRLTCPAATVVECGTAAEVTAQISDPDGDAMVVVWTLNGTTIHTNLMPNSSPGAINNISISPSFLLGTNILGIGVTDGTNVTSCTSSIKVVDTISPNITCAPNKTVQCGTSWSFDSPSGSDACCGTNVSITVLGTATNVCGSGSCVASFTRIWLAADCSGNTSTCSQTVKVIDTQPPKLSRASANPATLWPPNHKFVPVTIQAAVSDGCDPVPTWRIKSVAITDRVTAPATAQEPDFRIMGAHTLLLRAERNDARAGRTYRIVLESRDASGNTAPGSVLVTVPGAGSKPWLLPTPR
jgi:sugar lactone lactonase YvrE